MGGDFPVFKPCGSDGPFRSLWLKHLGSNLPCSGTERPSGNRTKYIQAYSATHKATSGCPTVGFQRVSARATASSTGQAGMGEYSRFLRETYSKDESDQDTLGYSTIFKLRNASQMVLRDVGLPLFEYDRRKPKVEAYVPKEEDQRHLTKREQSWMLVEIPADPDYSQYALAALRPLRTIAWEKYAQERSDGFFSPAGWIPKYPEPSKWYKHRPGIALEHHHDYPDTCKRLRLLVRLSDALNRAALDRTQDWFFLNLPHSTDSPAPENVGDLLLFAADLVGNDRLRPGHLTISAGRHNGRLWQCKTPLRVLWNYSQVASLRLGQEVPAFSALNSVENSSRLVGCTDTGAGEGAHFAMVAIHCLPQGISSDEDRELRALQAPGVCYLPHEELDKDILAEEERQQAITTSQSNDKKLSQTSQAASASTGVPASKTKAGRGGRKKVVAFQ